MVAHGTKPYGRKATRLFLPYLFSSRGPVTGIASAPVVLVTGGPRRKRLAAPPTAGAPTKDDSVTLVAFAHRVTCRYALRFAHR